MQAGAVIVKVGGMTCSSCVSTVENAVKALPFVDSCSVNLVTTKAEVKIRAAAGSDVFDVITYKTASHCSVDLKPGSEPVEEIVDTIEGVGFDAEVIGITKFEAKESTETAVIRVRVEFAQVLIKCCRSSRYRACPVPRVWLVLSA